jgi:hypothetical protein
MCGSKFMNYELETFNVGYGGLCGAGVASGTAEQTAKNK